ncbi:MAG: toprim domain-containing protein [Candidatus Nitrosotenuis sp.]
MNQTDISRKFKKLDEISHVLLRPGRYIGSITKHTENAWVFDVATKKMVRREVTWVPAFLKIFDELLSNSLDHSKTAEGKNLDQIRIYYDQSNGEIICQDNGGIPVVMHNEHGQYIPDMIYDLRAGSNFNDDDAETAENNQFVTGQNGEGAALTAIFSKEFKVQTADGKKQFTQTRSNNSKNKSTPKITDSDKNFTRITYVPDYERFGMTGLDDDTVAILLKRVVDAAGTHPNLKVYINSERIHVRDFADYIEMYLSEASPDYVYEANEHWKVGISASDGFEHISFVNGTHTRTGGVHVDYIRNQICQKLREFFKKKHKVDVKPSDLSNHIRLYIDASIVRPRYDSQTKDNLITEFSAFGTRIDLSDKFIQKITKTPIVQSVLEWIEAKEIAENLRKLQSMNKQVGKADPRKVEKFVDATERVDRKNCVLLVAEGDSAAKALIAGRGKNPYIGSFPLKGKPLNVRDREIKRITGNDEISKLLTIIGLQLGTKVESVEQLRFGKICVATDADDDGAHISGLLINFFEKFFPELFDLGVIHIFRTPVIKVFHGKNTYSFFTKAEFDAWERTEGVKLRGWKSKWYKGLGTSTSKEFAEYIANIDKHMVQLEIVDEDDNDAIDLAFNSTRANDRKVWLETGAEEFI